MPKLSLLKTEADFAQFRLSRSFQGPTLKIRVKWNNNQNAARFGFIIPKKVLSKVTDRNVLKRRLKSILAKYQPNFLPASVLIFPSARTLKKTFADLESETTQLLKQAKVWKS